MRFLHTADWQIGMKAAHVGAVGQRVRDERLAAARRVMEEAAQRLQVLVITCHPERYRGLDGAQFFDLEAILHDSTEA
jgi:hypothetical protein